VVVFASGATRGRALSTRLATMQRELADAGVRLAVGASTVRDDLAQTAQAYAEASWALNRLGPDGGVLCLAELTPFEYLTMGGDDTVRRLVPAEIQAFVADDLADGGVLTATVLEYASASLNAK